MNEPILIESESVEECWQANQRCEGGCAYNRRWRPRRTRPGSRLGHRRSAIGRCTCDCGTGTRCAGTSICWRGRRTAARRSYRRSRRRRRSRTSAKKKKINNRLINEPQICGGDSNRRRVRIVEQRPKRKWGLRKDLQDAASIETAEFVGIAGRMRFILSCHRGATSNGWMLIRTVLVAVDVAVAHPLDGDAAACVIAAEFVLSAHSFLTVFRFICKNHSNQLLSKLDHGWIHADQWSFNSWNEWEWMVDLIHRHSLRFHHNARRKQCSPSCCTGTDPNDTCNRSWFHRCWSLRRRRPRSRRRGRTATWTWCTCRYCNGTLIPDMSRRKSFHLHHQSSIHQSITVNQLLMDRILSVN